MAAKVRGIAAEKRVKQGDLAVALNVSRMAIVRRFNGSVPFTDRELIALSERLDVPVGAFFGEVAA
ncbi:proline/betaine transporter [Leifsonia xyli subsp. cynodontis DSM 46306]|uniref:HTH cro/C1-type domain-containing protein n=1 Tax=Leifsonia xyli subsp. cynodontis DSM 46306 TaxID=1389489 RepID=U3P7E6_LEIXC|nr:proline/betaine transporter [Leifsonia xyli subsp. cynodontis DSM 46306]